MWGWRDVALLVTRASEPSMADLFATSKPEGLERARRASRVGRLKRNCAYQPDEVFPFRPRRLASKQVAGSIGSPAAPQQKGPLALRPRLATGLPFSVDDNAAGSCCYSRGNAQGVAAGKSSKGGREARGVNLRRGVRESSR